MKYQLRHIKNEEGAFALLSGLATVAAVTGSGILAEELRVLLRAVRHRPGIDISPEDTTRIVMVAAAGYSDRDEWRKFVGECLSELAFEDMDRDQAGVLSQHIQTLCQLDQVLWETCGTADAACTALASSTAGQLRSDLNAAVSCVILVTCVIRNPIPYTPDKNKKGYSDR